MRVRAMAALASMSSVRPSRSWRGAVGPSAIRAASCGAAWGRAEEPLDQLAHLTRPSASGWRTSRVSRGPSFRRRRRAPSVRRRNELDVAGADASRSLEG